MAKADGGNVPDATSADSSTRQDTGGVTPGDSGGPTDSSMIPADAQTCVHNDDCTGPSICTSGFQCLGGLCIPTNKPQNCDDGVPCTADTCNASTNQCEHARLRVLQLRVQPVVGLGGQRRVLRAGDQQGPRRRERGARAILLDDMRWGAASESGVGRPPTQ